VTAVTAIALDFLGIGAPKAGTTSVHEYLRTHPQLWLPEAKEQPFFSSDAAYAEGWESFAAVAFHGAPPGRRYGKITPHYMGGPVAWRDATAAAETESATAVTARRIAERFPEVQLIAMVRDPVERAISSYWQTTVLGDDDRGLNQALEEELSEEALAAARARPTDGHQHIVAGEYGQMIEAYLRHFPATIRWRCCAISTASWASLTRTFPPTSVCAIRCAAPAAGAACWARCPAWSRRRPGCATPGTRSPTGRGRAPGRTCARWRIAWINAGRRAARGWTSAPIRR
jgi:sulfotransferase family protein